MDLLTAPVGHGLIEIPHHVSAALIVTGLRRWTGHGMFDGVGEGEVPSACRRRLAIEDGLTMIISTHQLRFAEEVADRVLLLSGGTIVEEGPAREVLTNPKTTVAQRFLSAMAEEAS